MVWNYRVVKDRNGLSLHEVYYQRDDATHPYAMTTESIVGPYETRQEMIDDLTMMLKTAKNRRRPVFVPPKRWDKRRKK